MEVDLGSLRRVLSGADTEKKVASLTELHSALQTATQVDDADELTELLKLGLHSSNAHVSTAAIGCLSRYFALLATATATPPSDAADLDPASHTAAHNLKHALLALLPLHQLADSKERVREAARDALVAAGRTALALGVNAGVHPGGKDKEGPWQYLSRSVHEAGFSSKSPRAREQAIHYVLALRNPALTAPLAPLRPFTPLLLPLLSDADPSVRSLALAAVTSIFSSPAVTAAARADLKKEFIKHDVGKKVQDTILAAVIGGAALERSSSAGSLLSDMGSTTAAGHGGSSQKGSSEAGSERSGPAAKPRLSPAVSATPPMTASARPRPTKTTAAVVPSLLASLPSAAFPSDPATVHEPTTDIEPLYIASERDLHGEFEAMKHGFEGKETEHNWMVRDRSVARIRGMLKGKAHESFLDGFISGIKSVQEGILKTASSLRTTVATNALSLVTELSNSLGLAFDPLLEPFLSHCLGMAGQTKKLVATASQAACKALITNSAYHLKTVQLLWVGMNDKIVLARTFVSAHVRTFVVIHGRHARAQIEQTGGLDVLEQCVRKGLTDANALVKENSRATFWLASEIWPKMTDRIMAAVDSTTKKQLDKADPKKAAAAPAAKVARPSVRSMIAQAKAAPNFSDSASSSPAQVSRQSSTTPRATPASPPRGPIAPASPPTPSRVPLRKIVPPASIPPDASTSPSTPVAAEPLPPLAGEEPLDLMHLSSPFLGDDGDSSLDFSKHVSGPETPLLASLPRPRNATLVLPVTEPIVDAALRSQADQAEQAAQRLLELAELDAEDDAGERGQVIGPGGHLVDRSARERTVTPLQNFHRTPVTMRRHDVFEDSPDVRDPGYVGNGAARGNWWMKKVDTLPMAEPLQPDSAERTEEIASLVSALQSGQVTLSGLRQLSLLSRERPLRDDDDGASVLASPTKADGPAEFGATSFWDGARTFSRVFDGLSNYLLREDTQDRRDAALVLLKDLVENQFPAFAGDELEVFELLFKLREDSSRTTIAAVEAIAEVFCSRLEPLYGLGSLRSSLTTYLAHPEGTKDAKAYALGLRLLGKLFERIPSEILEDELPKSKGLIKAGLNDVHSGDLRRAAVTALVSAQTVLQDEERLGILVDGLAPDQRNLLAYYIERSKKR